MFETSTYDDPGALPQNARFHWSFMETNSESAVIEAVCPSEWEDVIGVLTSYRQEPRY